MTTHTPGPWERIRISNASPCLFCKWCLFNLKWHGRAYLSLCLNRRDVKGERNG